MQCICATPLEDGYNEVHFISLEKWESCKLKVIKTKKQVNSANKRIHGIRGPDILSILRKLDIFGDYIFMTYLDIYIYE